MPHELTTNQINHCFEVSSYAAQQQRTISQSDCDMLWKVDFTRQPATTSTVVGPRSSKALCKAKGCAKKSHGYCLVVCCPSDPLVFWGLVKPLHLRSMLSKLMRYTKNCKACNQHWSIAWAHFSWKRPTAHLRTQRFKSWTNWAMKFCLICHIHLASLQLTTTSSSILTTLCKENTSAISRMQIMLSKSSSNPKA